MAIEALSDIARAGNSAFAGGGSGISATVEIDSATPYISKFFIVSVPGAVAGQKVICSPSLDMPIGVAQDELEADPITVAGVVSGPGSVRMLVASVNGSPIGGKRNINLVLA